MLWPGTVEKKWAEVGADIEKAETGEVHMCMAEADIEGAEAGEVGAEV